MNIVTVEWIDVMTYTEKQPMSRAMSGKMALCKTSGFLLYEDETKIIVALTIWDIPESLEQWVSDYTIIPKGIIINRSPVAQNGGH